MSEDSRMDFSQVNGSGVDVDSLVTLLRDADAAERMVRNALAQAIVSGLCNSVVEDKCTIREVLTALVGTLCARLPIEDIEQFYHDVAGGHTAWFPTKEDNKR